MVGMAVKAEGNKVVVVIRSPVDDGAAVMQIEVFVSTATGTFTAVPVQYQPPRPRVDWTALYGSNAHQPVDFTRSQGNAATCGVVTMMVAVREVVPVEFPV